MTLDELQAMSNEQLNELAAVQVMGLEAKNIFRWETVVIDPNDPKRSQFKWNPTGDMDDAIQMMDKFRISELKWDKQFGYAAIIEGSAVFHKVSPSRAITIAAILAKQEDKHGEN